MLPGRVPEGTPNGIVFLRGSARVGLRVGKASKTAAVDILASFGFGKTVEIRPEAIDISCLFNAQC
jgi:hypothetical protein